jgi:hypothetical protein
LKAIDPGIDTLFDKMILPAEYFDSSGNRKKGYIAETFKKASGVEATAMLSNLQQIARTIENRMVQFCHNKIGETDCGGWYFGSSPIVIQSSSVVQGGETIEIVAGVGKYGVRGPSPIIIINGKAVEIGDDGTARYAIVAGKEGEHVVPVKIEYTDEFGTRGIYEKQIRYKVR